jgi:hypothetical protein
MILLHPHPALWKGIMKNMAIHKEMQPIGSRQTQKDSSKIWKRNPP